MAEMSETTGGIVLLHTVLGDFFVAGESPLHAEARETGGQARDGLAMLSARLEPGGTVLDLGAGVGMLAVPLQRLVGATGRVWCFEPDAGASALLRRNLALNGLDLLARVVPGDAWPRLDDWSEAVGLDRLDAIRAHGPGAAAALAAGGLNTLSRHLPLVLFTGEPGAPAGTGEMPPAAHLARLGYSFHSGADAPAEYPEAPAVPAADLEAGSTGNSVLAVPPGAAGGTSDG